MRPRRSARRAQKTEPTRERSRVALVEPWRSGTQVVFQTIFRGILRCFNVTRAAERSPSWQLVAQSAPRLKILLGGRVVLADRDAGRRRERGRGERGPRQGLLHKIGGSATLPLLRNGRQVLLRADGALVILDATSGKEVIAAGLIAPRALRRCCGSDEARPLLARRGWTRDETGPPRRGATRARCP